MTDNVYYVKGRRDLFLVENFKNLRPKIKAVAFDIDGTLTDSIGQIVQCTHYTFDKLKIKRIDDDVIKGMIGKKLHEGLVSILPKEYLHLQDKIADIYRQTFIEHDEIHKSIVFDGVAELFKVLKAQNIKIGYASGKSTIGIKRNLNETVLGAYCDGFCAGDEVPSKPDPKMAQVLATRLNVNCDEILGVGDAAMDVQMFQNAGCYSCGVQSGVWSGDALLTIKPDLIVPKVSDLIALFKS